VVRSDGELTLEALSGSGEVVGKSKPLSGDAIDAAVAWEQAPNFDTGAVRFRFTFKNADLFSLRFD
jgi:hypothetical protein